MIHLTRLSGQPFALNPDLIERIEATPDTLVTLVDGTRHVVTEDIDQVVERVRYYRAGVVALSQMLAIQMAEQAVDPPTRDTMSASPPLRLISQTGGES